jgi:hypothetical protein
VLNNVDLGGTTDDNDISKFRVHYRDTDGFGTLASVAVKLQRFAVGAGGVAESTVVCSWTSDIDDRVARIGVAGVGGSVGTIVSIRLLA